MFPTQVFPNIFNKEECNELLNYIKNLHKNPEEEEWENYKDHESLTLVGNHVMGNDFIYPLITRAVNKIIDYINSIQRDATTYRFWRSDVWINYYENETKYFPTHNHGERSERYPYDYSILLSLGDTRVFEIGGPVTKEDCLQKLDPGEVFPEYHNMKHGQVILFDGIRNHGLLREKTKKKERISLVFGLGKILVL